MREIGFPRKFISLTKMCMNDTKYQVKVDRALSEEFETGLKQGDSISTLLFNIALEKIIRNVKNNNLRTNIGVTQIDILGFADDIIPIGDSMEIVKQNTSTLVEGAK